MEPPISNRWRSETDPEALFQVQGEGEEMGSFYKVCGVWCQLREWLSGREFPAKQKRSFVVAMKFKGMCQVVVNEIVKYN